MAEPPVRPTLLGVARVRSAWFSTVASWANASLLACDFRKCLSVAEVRERGDAGPSVAILDAGANDVDAGAVGSLVEAGVPVLVVADAGASAQPWIEAGAATVLHDPFGVDDLRDAIASTDVARPRRTRTTGHRDLAGTSAGEKDDLPVHGWRGALVAVTGVRGAGASTVAMALAQGLASRSAHRGDVVLADLRCDAAHALYHDVRDVVPGLQELCDAITDVGATAGGPRVSHRRLLFDVDSRGYVLLAGMRRRRDTRGLPAALVAAAVDVLRSAHRIVVADVDASDDDRLLAADRVVAVGDATLRGVHGLVGIERDLVEVGVDRARLLRVVNRAPRSPRARAELTSTLRHLAAGGRGALVGPLFLPERRGLEVVHQLVAPLPDPLTQPLLGAVGALGPTGRAAPAGRIAAAS